MPFGIIHASSAWADETLLYDVKGKRDPFVPLVAQTSRQVATGLIGVESIADLSIDGLVYDPKGGSMVIANGAVLRDGEEQGSVKVLRIDEAGALFLINGMEGYKTQYEIERNGISHES